MSKPKWLRRVCNYCPASAVCFACWRPRYIEASTHRYTKKKVIVTCFCPLDSEYQVFGEWKDVSFTVLVSKLKRSNE